MNKTLVVAEWKRATESFGAAQSCRRDGFYADSVSRAYYAILHSAKAALLLYDIAAESHAAVKRLFGFHLVQTGLVEGEWGSLIGESFDVRLMADYDIVTPFSDEDAREEYDHAKAFLIRIRELLFANGLTPEELHTEVLDA